MRDKAESGRCTISTIITESENMLSWMGPTNTDVVSRAVNVLSSVSATSTIL